jgi:hypothetical protein
MNIFKQRMLNVARALRESPAPDDFTMSTEFHDCGTPACAWGHYLLRRDLQNAFMASLESIDTEGFYSGLYSGYAHTSDGRIRELVYSSLLVRAHFGIDFDETEEVFGPFGCNDAQSAREAAEYIEWFAERKWPEPKRSDSELVADMMTRVMGERIPEDVT